MDGSVSLARLHSYVKVKSVFIIYRLRRYALVWDFQKVQENKTSGSASLT